MKQFILLCCGLSAMLASVVYAQTKAPVKTYSGAGFTLSYPVLWDVENGKDGITNILSPKETPADAFREGLSVVTQPLPRANATLDEYVEQSRKSIDQMNQKPGSTAVRKIRQGNKDMYRMSYDAGPAQSLLHFDCLMWIAGNKAYVITFCAPKTTYQFYKKPAEDIFASLHTN